MGYIYIWVIWGFPKMEVPLVIIHFNRIFLDKPSIVKIHIFLASIPIPTIPKDAEEVMEIFGMLLVEVGPAEGPTDMFFVPKKKKKTTWVMGRIHGESWQNINWLNHDIFLPLPAEDL